MMTPPIASKISNPDVKRAIIPFLRPDPRNLEKGQYHTYKLRTTSTDPTSPVYELSVPFFDEGTPEEWIKFRCGLSAVRKGQNITQGPASYTVAKTLLKGDTLTMFKQEEIIRGNQTLPHFNECLDDFAGHVFPEKTGQIQKCYMQRNLQFTKNLTVKEW
eukprot:12612639-Ditylum_brightwellii.AAC.1